MWIDGMPELVVGDQMGYFVYQRDQEGVFIQVVVDRDGMVLPVVWSHVIAQPGTPLFFDLQLEVVLHDPFCDRTDTGLRKIFFQDLRVFLVLNGAQIHRLNLTIFAVYLAAEKTIFTNIPWLMDTEKIISHITDWLGSYSANSFTEGFVVGISGGIDSAVTSTLCAMTGRRVIALNMPIRQFKTEFDRSSEHIAWLSKHYKNVETVTTDLTPVLESFEAALDPDIQDFLTMANTRARIRMTTLYAFATRHRLLVAGTGNKIEDFGIGFFTKYGDGGVDISPIADLTKTQVYALAKHMGIVGSIQNARPTDGLFADGRTDEDQIGATYPELEWAMAYLENKEDYDLNARQKHVLEIYTARNKANQHKMRPVPVCIIPEIYK
jgi:NAD+ synthase